MSMLCNLSYSAELHAMLLNVPYFILPFCLVPVDSIHQEKSCALMG